MRPYHWDNPSMCASSSRSLSAVGNEKRAWLRQFSPRDRSRPDRSRQVGLRSFSQETAAPHMAPRLVTFPSFLLSTRPHSFTPPRRSHLRAPLLFSTRMSPASPSPRSWLRFAKIKKSRHRAHTSPPRTAPSTSYQPPTTKHQPIAIPETRAAPDRLLL